MKTKILLSGLAFAGAIVILASCSESNPATNESGDLKSVVSGAVEAVTPPCPYNPTSTDSSVTASCCTVTGTLTADETAGLLFMREEEKMARDVYTYFNEKYQLPVFKNIAKSESAHLAAVYNLITSFGITDNSTNDPGVFTNENLRDLYQKLIAMGDVSVVEALKVGVLIEQTDIADLESELAITQNASVKTVYSHLLAASNIHLKAFTWNLSVRGITYP